MWFQLDPDWESVPTKRSLFITFVSQCCPEWVLVSYFKCCTKTLGGNRERAFRTAGLEARALPILPQRGRPLLYHPTIARKLRGGGNRPGDVRPPVQREAAEEVLGTNDA